MFLSTFTVLIFIVTISTSCCLPNQTATVGLTTITATSSSGTKIASLICHGSNVASIEDPARKHYFPETSPEMFATSNCTKEFPFFAYIKCVASDSSAKFDRSTLFESSCNVTRSSLDMVLKTLATPVHTIHSSFNNYQLQQFRPVSTSSQSNRHALFHPTRKHLTLNSCHSWALLHWRSQNFVSGERSYTGAIEHFFPVNSLATRLTAENVARTLDNIAVFTSLEQLSNQSDRKPNGMKMAHNAVGTLGKRLENSDVQIKPSAMDRLMLSVQNIYNAQARAAQSAVQTPRKHDLAHCLEVSASHLNMTGRSSFRSITENLEVYVVSRNLTESTDGILFTKTAKSLSSYDGTNHIRGFIPANALQMAVQEMKAKTSEDHLSEALVNVAFFLHEDDMFFREENQPSNIRASKVLTAQIGLQHVNNLTEPFVYQLPLVSESNSEGKLYRCSYWHTGKMQWAFDGCKMNTSSNPPSCFCDHMTNFALLVQSFPESSSYGLDIVGKVCLSISVVGLSLTLIIFLCYEKIRQKCISLIHVNLCLCLLISKLMFLILVERPRAFIECSAVAAVLHFFLVSAFGWMMVECFTMYRMLVKVFTNMGSHYVVKAGRAVYSLAALVVTITIGVTIGWQDEVLFDGWTSMLGDRPSTYISNKMCWLHGSALYFGFLLPAGICLVLNFVGFFFIIRAITWGRKQVRSFGNDRITAKDSLIRAVVISVLLGLTWSLGIPLTFSEDIYTNRIFGWLFSVINGLQGAALFFLLCVKQRDVRDLWWIPMKRFICCHDGNDGDTRGSGTTSLMRQARHRFSMSLSLSQRMKRSSSSTKNETKDTDFRASTFRHASTQ